MKKYLVIFAMLLCCSASMFAAEAAGVESSVPEFLTGFASFTGLVTIVVPSVVGFIASKLQNPMNKWVTMWVTAVVGIAVTFFSWWMGLGFPPSDATIWIVVIDSIFIALASAGVVSIATSEWLARLFGAKVEN